MPYRKIEIGKMSEDPSLSSRKMMDAYEAAEGNTEGAAKILGISRRTFDRLVKSLKLESKKEKLRVKWRDIRRSRRSA